MNLSPTPHPDVNTAVLSLAARIHSILAGQFLGLYLYGSLALGDFNPQTSDIDMLLVTQGEIAAGGFEALKEMHADFDRGSSPYARKIEVAYIPLDALNHRAPTAAVYPQIERGTELFTAPLENGWAFQRWALRERGIAVAGPATRLLVEPVDPRDMQRAAALIAGRWQEQSLHDPSWLDWARQRDGLSFLVLTLCRLLYSLESGTVVSKPTAARWALHSLGGRWDALIRRSLAGQHEPGAATQVELNELLALLRRTLDQSQRAVACE